TQLLVVPVLHLTRSQNGVFILRVLIDRPNLRRSFPALSQNFLRLFVAVLIEPHEEVSHDSPGNVINGSLAGTDRIKPRKKRAAVFERLNRTPFKRKGFSRLHLFRDSLE